MTAPDHNVPTNGASDDEERPPSPFEDPVLMEWMAGLLRRGLRRRAPPDDPPGADTDTAGEGTPGQ